MDAGDKDCLSASQLFIRSVSRKWFSGVTISCGTASRNHNNAWIQMTIGRFLQRTFEDIQNKSRTLAFRNTNLCESPCWVRAMGIVSTGKRDWRISLKAVFGKCQLGTEISQSDSTWDTVELWGRETLSIWLRSDKWARNTFCHYRVNARIRVV